MKISSSAAVTRNGTVKRTPARFAVDGIMYIAALPSDKTLALCMSHSEKKV